MLDAPYIFLRLALRLACPRGMHSLQSCNSSVAEDKNGAKKDLGARPV